MKKTPLSRRTLLQGAGGIAIGLPFLEAMMPPNAIAANGVTKKFISLFSGCGVTQTFYPTGTELAFNLSTSLAPLESHKNRLLLFDGITNDVGDNPEFGGHQGSHVGMISGQPFIVSPTTAGSDNFEKMRPTAPSLDQVIAQKLAKSAPSKFNSIQVGVLSPDRINNAFDVCASFTGEKALLMPEADPAGVFDLLFKDAGAGAAQADLLRLKRKSVLDFVKERYSVLNARLGADDKARVDQHLTSIREVELQLSGAANSACKIPSRPGKLTADNLNEYAKAQIDLMTIAIACDLTHVASLTWFGTRGGNYNYSSVIPEATMKITDHHHNLSHELRFEPQISAINAYVASQMAYMMTSLDKYKDASGGSLLDSTMILWWNELGYSDRQHSCDPSPFVLGGGAGGAVKMGRFLDYKSGFQSNNNLLLSIYNAVTDSQDITFGDPRYCKGVLPRFFG